MNYWAPKCGHCISEKKVRDLFDLWHALTTTSANIQSVVDCFLHYMEHEGHKVSRAEFEQNLIEKLGNATFAEDIEPLLITGTVFDSQAAAEYVMSQLLPRIPGETWQGWK